MEILIWILAAYGMSQILVFGAIFDKPRNWITRHSTFFGDLLSCMKIEYTNVFFDGMLASGAVWSINAIIEWFEENKPKDQDNGPGIL